jgi:hypothetical protein
MKRLPFFSVLSLTLASLTLSGCHRPSPSFTAMPASPQNMCEPEGIPFYLPKPLLVISKNFYHVEEPKVGLNGNAPIPDSFDKQESYAAANLQGSFSRAAGGAAAATDPKAADAPGASGATANSAESVVPAANEIPSDGLAPHTFFTYEIVFVPDLTQKYTMKLTGGPGEIRAAMNLVNGWQFTGLGPFYLKDSSTAQNTFANGAFVNLGLGGVSDVVNSVANLRKAAATPGGAKPAEIAEAVKALTANAAEVESVRWDFSDPTTWPEQDIVQADGSIIRKPAPPRLERFAEIHVYEAKLIDGDMIWQPVADHAFDREFLGFVTSRSTSPSSTKALDLLDRSLSADIRETTSRTSLPELRSDTVAFAATDDPAVIRDVVAQAFCAPEKKQCHPLLRWLDPTCRSQEVNRSVNLSTP